MVLGCQPVRIAAGHLDSGYTSMHEILGCSSSEISHGPPRGLAKGIGHFRTPIETGRRIIRSLRGHTSGMAVPYFVVDAPNGGGKIPVNPDYVVRHEGKRWTFRNYAGKLYTYDEP